MFAGISPQNILGSWNSLIMGESSGVTKTWKWWRRAPSFQWRHDVRSLQFSQIYLKNGHHELVGGWPTPLEKWWSSSNGMMKFPTEWKVIKFHGSKSPTGESWWTWWVSEAPIHGTGRLTHGRQAIDIPWIDRDRPKTWAFDHEKNGGFLYPLVI